MLPKRIMELAVDGEIQRLTLFDHIGRAPDSGSSNTWVAGSARYGLTAAGDTVGSLSVTGEGRAALGEGISPRDTTAKHFQLAIAKIECFNSLYERIKTHRLPVESVLGDELGKLGVADIDRRKASEIFIANLRFLDLITEITGSEHVRTIEEVLAETPENTAINIEEAGRSDDPIDVSLPSATPAEPTTNSGPALHLDIQVHIDASASPDQIEQIFASMARHLYGRNP